MSDAVVSLECPKDLERLPLVGNNRKFPWITQAVSEIVEGRTPKWWWLLFLPCALIATIRSGSTCCA